MEVLLEALSWFPVYLAQARHMSILRVGFAAAVPGLCGGVGGILGGVLSDKLVHRGHWLSFARKVPIMAGMALSMTIIACNHAQTQHAALDVPLFLRQRCWRMPSFCIGPPAVSRDRACLGIHLRWNFGLRRLRQRKSSVWHLFEMGIVRTMQVAQLRLRPSDDAC